MRLDKFLKVSRIIKRRTIAKEVADKGRIEVNGITAKSSTDVKIGDELSIAFGNKTLVVKIDRIIETTKKDEAAHMYTIIIEALAKALFSRNSNFEKVVAIKIPNVRAMMHLDTVFTMVDYDKFTIHPSFFSK